ncbi:MAG: hypothetical protein J1E63_02545 [Muribaculaceae bacterium]|nr:hypothetical protein [Muribaculaceae bacterium]
MIKQLLRKAKARYRAAGHGIHSPFAYRFVTDVMRHRRGYAFYGYSDIEAATTDSRRRRFACLALRVAAAMSPGETIIEGNDTALGVALTGIARRGNPPLMVVGPDGSPSTDSVNDVIAAGGTIILAPEHRDFSARMQQLMTAGMSFTTPAGTTVIVANPRLPLSHYTVSN